jgi:hypothetical protein
MSDAANPPGWSHNPSAYLERLPVLLLGLCGLGIATYLGLYQLDLIPTVWEPFFGSGSHVILKESALVRALHPVPDSLLGAFAYFVDVVLNCTGGQQRWRTLPWAVLALGLVGIGLAFGGVLLTLFQAFWFKHYCTLCLASALCSVLMVGFVWMETWATCQHLQRVRATGGSVRQALWGKQPPAAPHRDGT